jgi:RNA polymerase sigma-70 factor (ECF subfamily)
MAAEFSGAATEGTESVQTQEADMWPVAARGGTGTRSATRGGASRNAGGHSHASHPGGPANGHLGSPSNGHLGSPSNGHSGHTDGQPGVHGGPLPSGLAPDPTPGLTSLHSGHCATHTGPLGRNPLPPNGRTGGFTAGFAATPTLPLPPVQPGRPTREEVRADPVREPTREPVRDPVRETPLDAVRDCLPDGVLDPLQDAVRESLQDAVRESLHDAVHDQRHDLREPGHGAVHEPTVEIRSLANLPPAVSDPPTVATTAWPSRPAPDDAAAEVWALVERAQAGEADAFGKIYDRYFDTVFRFIYFRVGNRPLAEDLTADTFLRALKRISSFTWQGRDLGAWLVTIARNLVADHFKSGRYRLEVTTGDVLDADDPERGPEGSPEAAVVDHITNVALLAAVKQLNPEQQECIVLRFLQGFSVAETAHAMGKNEGAIKALQYRAVRALHRLLPDGFQP